MYKISSNSDFILCSDVQDISSAGPQVLQFYLLVYTRNKAEMFKLTQLHTE